MCNCQSYNRPDVGTVKPVTLTPPPWSSKTGIDIDACIAPVIQKLWDAGIQTGGSCCGHKSDRDQPSPFGWIGGQPTVFLIKGEDAAKAMEIIKENDERDWIILLWSHGL